MPISQGIPLKALASAVIGGRVDSQGRLMLQHADGSETASGTVKGAPGTPGTPGTDATQAQVMAALMDWMAAHPAAQAVTGLDVPATTVTLGFQTRDVTVTWAKPWPDTAYEVVGFVATTALLFGKITPGTAKNKTTTGCVMPVDIATTLSLGGAKLHVLGLRA